MPSQNLPRTIYCLIKGACVGIILPALLTAQRPMRVVDISKYGMVSVATNQGLRLRAEAAPGGRGCKAQLLYLTPTGGSAAKSLSINLAPGTSAFDDFKSGTTEKVTLVKPSVWVFSTEESVDCILSLSVLGSTGLVERSVNIPEYCSPQQCRGESAESLKDSRLRISVFATDGNRCRAQLGFKLSHGTTAAASKYLNLISDRGGSIEWNPAEDEDLKPGDQIVPVVAFHDGDNCVASAEVLRGTTSPTFVSVPLEFYASSTVGLATNPTELPTTISTLSSELAKNPDDVWVMDSLAQAYAKEGLQSLAIRLLTAWLVSNPKDATTWFLLAKTQYEKNLFQNAEQSLKSYLRLKPDDPQGLTAFGLTLTQLRQFQEARRTLSPLLENPSTRNPAVLNAWARLLSAEGNSSEALHFVEESDRLHPSCKFTLYLKANILYDMGQFSDSRTFAERAVQLDPNYGMARLLLARAYRKEGKLEEARNQEAWLRQNFETTK